MYAYRRYCLVGLPERNTRKISQKMYLLLLQLSIWLRYIEKIRGFCEIIH